MNPPYLVVFLEYFIPTFLIVFVMLYRVAFLKILLVVFGKVSEGITRFLPFTSMGIMRLISAINSQQFIFFTKGDNVANLNKVLMYIIKNEHTNRLKIVNVLREGETETPNLRHDIEVLDRAYPELVIDFVVLHDKFGPELIERLSQDWDIPKNFMFIGSPGDSFPYGIEDLGGVRLVI